MESVFALPRNYALDRCSWATREQLCIPIVTWIERIYRGADLSTAWAV